MDLLSLKTDVFCWKFIITRLLRMVALFEIWSILLV